MLWEKIWVGSAFPDNLLFTLERLSNKALDLTPREELVLKNKAFYEELARKEEIFDRTEAKIDFDTLSSEEQSIYGIFKDGSAKKGLIKAGADPNEMNPLPAPDEVVLRLLSQASPERAIRAFPSLDLFFADRECFQYYHSLKANVLLTSIEAIVPREPDSISVSQIINFRERTRLQREKFKLEIEANQIFKNILNCSSEEELQGQMRLCEEYLREQLEFLKQEYRKCKIETFVKTIGMACAPPALLMALSSALNVPFYIPGVIVSILLLNSAVILEDLEKGRSDIRKSPWG